MNTEESRVFAFAQSHHPVLGLTQDVVPQDMGILRIHVSRERFEEIIYNVEKQHRTVVEACTISDLLYAPMRMWLRKGIVRVRGIPLESSDILPAWAVVVQCHRQGRYLFDLRTLQELDK